MSERQGIEIDYCPTCRGIWLDRGELDKIIERAAGELAPQPPQAPSAPPAPPAPYSPQAPYPPQGGYDPRYDQGHHGHGYRPHHKRKKSWLEEIFD
jgi:hypothetical protein